MLQSCGHRTPHIFGHQQHTTGRKTYKIILPHLPNALAFVVLHHLVCFHLETKIYKTCISVESNKILSQFGTDVKKRYLRDILLEVKTILQNSV